MIGMLYIDSYNGVSGDMLVGALLDISKNSELIEKKLSPIAVINVRRIKKQGVHAVDFKTRHKIKDRSYPALLKSVRSLKLSAKEQNLTNAIIKTLAIAESKAHKTPLKKVHLHEATDIIVDAAAISILLSEIGWPEVRSSIVSVGELAPATKHIINSYTIPTFKRSDAEITTPTGVAILANIVKRYVAPHSAGLEGVGAGDKNFKYPNVLSATVTSDLTMLESNIDDCTPEILSYVMEALMDAGALDVHIIPCIMKKGRQGFLVRILTNNPNSHAKLLMQETGTLGVRAQQVAYRFESPRRQEKVKIHLNGKMEEVRVKVSESGAKPEFDDLRRLAKKHKIPLRFVREKVTKRIKTI